MFICPPKIRIIAKDEQANGILKRGLLTWRRGLSCVWALHGQVPHQALVQAQERLYGVQGRRGGDYGGQWPDDAQRILGHVMPGSCSECYNPEDTDTLYAMRFEQGCEPRRKLTVSPLKVEGKLAEIAALGWEKAMGYDIRLEVYKREEDSSYSKISVFGSNGKEYAIWYGSGMVSQLLTGFSRFAYSFEPLTGAHRGIPEFARAPESVAEGWEETGTYYDYLELKAHAANPMLKFKDECLEEDTGKVVYVRPLDDVICKLDIILEVNGVYSPEPGDIMIAVKESY